MNNLIKKLEAITPISERPEPSPEEKADMERQLAKAVKSLHETMKEIEPLFDERRDVLNKVNEHGNVELALLINIVSANVVLRDFVAFMQQLLEEIKRGGVDGVCKQLRKDLETLGFIEPSPTPTDSKIPPSNDFSDDVTFTILQGKAINALTKVRTNNLFSEQIDMLGNAEIKVGQGFTLRIKDYTSLKNGIPTTAYMLLDCLLIHFTEQPTKDARVRLPLKKYMQMRGLKDAKEARAQVLNDIKALRLIEYEAREKIKGKWTASGSISIFGGTGLIRNGIIYFNFNVDFFNVLINYRVMDYSKDTLRVNPKKHPHAYFFSRYIDENYRLNEGKQRESIITISTLISKAPNLPSYDEVMASPSRKGNIYQYIILPLIRDLDSIDRLFYDFISATDEIIQEPYEYFKGTGGYNMFIASKIKIDYSDYERHDKRITRRKKHTQKAQVIRRGKDKTKELEARIKTLEGK